jgi:hypothetical protein
MNREAPFGITSANEQGYHAGGIAVDYGAADSRLHLS